MKRDMENLNLRDTFKATPDKCRDALMTAARSVREEEPVRRISFRAVLIAACIILATMAIAIAATKTLGWADFFEIIYGDTNVITKEAQAIMDNTEKQTVTVGPVSFTVQSLFADEQQAMATTLITTADGSRALFVTEFYGNDYAVGDNEEFGEALAKLYGVDPETTWIDTAKKLNCPLYRVAATLHGKDPYDYGGGMLGDLYDEEGNLVYFSTRDMYMPDGSSYPLRADPVPMELWVQVNEIDLETGDEIHVGHTVMDVQVPMSLQSEPVEYRIPEDYVVFGLHLDSVKAAKTAAGVYLYVDFTDQDGMKYRKNYMYPVWTDENGEEYPDGLIMSYYIDTDQWPQVSVNSMIAADSIPERIWFQLLDEEKGEENVPPVLLELKK